MEGSLETHCRPSDHGVVYNLIKDTGQRNWYINMVNKKPQSAAEKIRELLEQTEVDTRPKVTTDKSKVIQPQEDPKITKERIDAGLKTHYTGDKPIETLKLPEVSKKRDGRGGARPGAGQPPKEATLIAKGIRKLIEDYVAEEVWVSIMDPKDPDKIKRIKVKKPVVITVMQHLYSLGMGQTEKGNATALKEWLDRALGKAPLPIKGDAGDDTPIRLEVDINKMLDKAYGNDTE
jgi:hypothetical protein